MRIREEITKLQEQLKAAETREAERIGRLALKAGFSDLEIAENEMVTAFEEIAARFQKGSGRGTTSGRTAVPSGAPQGTTGEA